MSMPGGVRGGTASPPTRLKMFGNDVGRHPIASRTGCRPHLLGRAPKPTPFFDFKQEIREGLRSLPRTTIRGLGSGAGPSARQRYFDERTPFPNSALFFEDGINRAA